MWIAVGSAIRGSAGRGTGTGGSDRTESPTFLTESTTGITLYFGVFSDDQSYPFTVHWGDGSSTEVTSGNSVSHSYSGSAAQYEVSFSGEKVFLYNDDRFGINTWIDTVYRFDTLGFGASTFKNLSPTMSGVTTTPGAFNTNGISQSFSAGTSSPPAIVLPNNIGDWDVSGVDDFVSVFTNVTPSSLGSQPASWTFGSSCSIGLNVFSPMTDADVAACLVAWAANVNQGTGVSVGEAFGSGRSLDETVYASAKAAYDTLIATYSWTFTNTITWTAPLPSGFAAGYSVRKLSSSFTGSALRVRRTVAPFDEQDIGFDSNGDLDTAAITTFGGSDPLTVSRWYDQSGNQNDATQGTSGSQPQIYNGTAVITENGKPVIDPDATDFLQTSLAGNATAWAFSVGKVDQIFQMFLSDAGTSPYVGFARDTQVADSWLGVTTPDHYLNGSSIAAPTRDELHTEMATQRLLSIDFDSSGFASYYVGFSSSIPMYNLQELIIYHSDQSSNRSGIESNINGYFNVYTVYNPDAPTSGFLFDYSGAAVAYSVRQLNNNATVALRVRRTVAPFDEQDIGFDGSGNLDTTAISTFGGSDSLTVSRWYDQTGNQDHLAQVTSGNQPQIYDGVNVVTEGSRPAIDFDRFGGAPKEFSVDISGAPLSQPVTYSYVTQLTTVSGYFNIGQLSGQATFALGLVSAGNFLSVQNWAGHEVNSIIFDSTTLRRVNGVQTNSGNAGTQAGSNPLRVSNTSTGNGWIDGTFQEFIVWNANQSTAGNIAGIETNQNTYYSIY